MPANTRIVRLEHEDVLFPWGDELVRAKRCAPGEERMERVFSRPRTAQHRQLSRFVRKCKAALKDHKPTRSATFGVDHDWKYLQVLSSVIVAGEEKCWTDLASNDKKTIDQAFYALFPVQ